MAYNKTVWVNGTAPPINAENLNKIEQGIESAHAIVPSQAGTDGQVLTKTATGTAWSDAGNPTDTQVATAVTAWLDENVTEIPQTAPIVDTSLTIQGAAADAKKAGDEISALKSEISDIEEQIEGGTGSGLTAQIKQALMDLANHVAWDGDDPTGQTYINALQSALYPPIVVTNITLNTNSLSFATLNSTQQLTATTTPTGGAVTWSSSNTSVATVSATGLVTAIGYGSATITATSGSVSATCSVAVAQATLTSISAVYTQSGTVYDTDSLDSLKSDLVVTATWSNQTTSTVASADYTLSGTLAEGVSTITVAYGSKEATFTVNVTESPLPSEYSLAPWVASLNTGTSSEYFVNTGVTPSTSGNIKIQIGFMQTTEAEANQYFIAMNSATGGGGSVGCGVYLTSDNASVGAFNGISSTIQPNGGNSMLNQYCDVTAEFTSTTSSITDGTLSAEQTGTGRTHNAPIYLFGLKHTYNASIAYPAKGRIYYAKVTDGDTLILDLIPCVRISDSKAGFYDVVHSNFITNDNLTAGV